MDRTPWGELEPSDEESSEEEEEEESEEEKPDETGFFTPADRYTLNTLAVAVLSARSLPHADVFGAWQWADHSRRLLIGTRRHGDPRTDRAEKEENRGGYGWVSASSVK